MEPDSHPSLRANMIWNTFGSMVRLGCSWLITIAVVRLSHGFDAAGVLSVAMSVSNLLAPFADCRLRTIQVTDSTGERTTGQYMALRIITVAGCLVVGLLYTFATCEPSTVPTVLCYLVYSLALSFFEVHHALNQRLLRMDFNGISYAMQGVCSLISFSAVLYYTNSVALAVASMAACVLAIGILYDVQVSRQLDNLTPTFKWDDIVRTLASVLPLAVAQACGSAVLTIPRQYLAVSYGNAALGIYSSVVAPAVIVQTGAVYVYSPVMGEIAKALVNDKKTAVSLIAKTSLGMSGVCVLVAAGLIVGGEQLLRLMFGNQISGNSFLLPWAIAYTFLTAYAWFLNDLLLSMRDFRASLLGNVLSAVCMFLLYRPLVDTFGMNGVSIVGIASYGISVLFLFAFFVRNYRSA